MSNHEVVFAMAEGQNAFFQELAEAFVFELGRLGTRSRITVGELPAVDRGRVTVLLPPHEFVALSEVELPPAVLRRCVLISAEQPSSGFFGVNAHLGRDAGALLDINRRAVRAYRGHGIPAEHLQLGYSQAWDRRDDVSERDIDLIFFGRVTDRRELALATYADILERFNCEIIFADNSVPNSEGGASFAAKESKLRLLARSKVLLNVHGEDEPYFEWLRVAEAASSGCAVVSEHSTDLEPLRPGDDLLVGSWESLGLLACDLLDDEDRRFELANNAEKRLQGEHSLAGAAATLLEAARRVGATPLDSNARAEATVARARLTLSPLRDRQDPAPPQPVEDVSPTGRRVLRALKRQQQELLSLRRRLAAEELARTRPEEPTARTLEEATTQAWREAERPVVSVIVPMFNGADTVRETLDSVTRSTMRGWEVVVVDDASTDGSGEVVRAWMEEHAEQRAALFRHEVNRGLASSRNTAAERARGEFLLMLDADNLIRPFGMARLMTALVEDTGAGFSYGILDRFDAHGKIGVLSKFGWEPNRFRHDNYIDALAMIRRRELFEMGGYSCDPRLALGLEDYDLWARMAEEGRRGTFVRQFVGSYRAGQTSMLSSTGISMADALAAISEHAPTLMRGVDVLSR